MHATFEGLEKHELTEWRGEIVQVEQGHYLGRKSTYDFEQRNYMT